MASKATLKMQRDKEMAAMMYNSKEQRVLEKSLQTLHLEQTYALKLLELDNRIIKVRYKKLKEKVSKIKSHLPVDDISNFRDLDIKGKLGPCAHSGVNLGSAIKIAAAARRLNLGSSSSRRRRGPRSALPTISVQREDIDLRSRSAVSISDPPVLDFERIKRPNSVSGAFIDAPDGEVDEGGKNRPSSAIALDQSRQVRVPDGLLNGLAHEPHDTRVNGVVSSDNSKFNRSTESNGTGHKIIPGKSGVEPSERAIKSKHRVLSQSAKPSTQSSHRRNLQNNTSSPGVIEPPVSDESFALIKNTLSVPNLDIRGHSDNAEDASSDEDITDHELRRVVQGSSAMPTFRSNSVAFHPRPRSPFSSHLSATKDEKLKTRLASAPARPNRRFSHISTDSIDSNLGESGQEERRQEMLEEESIRAATLDQRTKLFLQDVDDYLLQNPPLQPSHVAFEGSVREPPRRDSLIEAKSSSATQSKRAGGQRPGTAGKTIRFKQQTRRVGGDVDEDEMFTPTFFPEAQYKERLMGLWKDMNKCRYLRVSDEKIDLSGVNTLVKDQMKLFHTLKHAELEELKPAPSGN